MVFTFLKIPKIKIKIKEKELSVDSFVKNFFSILNPQSIYNIKVIATKEFKQFFATPLGYGLIILYLIIFSLLFFGIFGYLKIQSADLGLMFTAIGYTVAIVIPAVTMGVISKERNQGTLELVLTKPIKIRDFLIGKFVFVQLVILLILCLQLPIILITSQFVQSAIDPGIIFAQFVGAYLLSSAISSIGITFSSLFKNEITSLLSTIVVTAFFIIIGSGLLNPLPFRLDNFLARISLLSNYSFITQGVIDVKSVLYFIGFISVFLLLAYYLIIKDKFTRINSKLTNIRVLVMLLIVITLLIANFGQFINIKIDLTSNGLFTLSKETEQVLSKIKSPLSIKLYASNNIPVQLQPQVNTLENWLRDYESKNTNIKLTIVKENMSNELIEKARADGIYPSGVKVAEDQATQVTAGILFGISLRYLDKSASINILEDEQNITDFEYKITTSIYNLVRDKKPKVVISKNDPKLNDKYTLITKEISELFDLQEIDLQSNEITIPNDTLILIVFAGNVNIPESNLIKIKNYLANGGNLFFAGQGSNLYNIQDETPIFPQKNSSNLLDLLSEYGIRIAKNITFDLENYMRYPEQVNLFEYKFVDFFFGPEFLVYDPNSSITRNIFRLFTLWSSSIEIDKELIEAKGYTVKPLFKLSSKSGGINPEDYFQYVQKSKNFEVNSQNEIVSGLLLVPNTNNDKKGKIVVVSDTDFVENNVLLLFNQLDQIEQRSFNTLRRIFNNISFVINSLTYLSNEIDLGQIKAKNRAFPLIKLPDIYSTVVTTGGIGIPVSLTILIGILRISKRNKITKQIYVQKK
ncbi:MAG: Gldg family protein [Candidatus Dojkabacteria bacterium]|nr:Gldg family protein [Candidatus Dojkabacteria bacterium]